MSEGIIVVTGACDHCGLPTGKAAENSPCPYCGHPSAGGDTAQLRAIFYGLPLVSLQRLQLALRSANDAAIAETAPPLTAWLDANRDSVSTIVDVLLAMYVVAEETGPPDQVNEVIVNVLDGRLDRLPLARRGPCFCDSGKRYGKCHGRA